MPKPNRETMLIVDFGSQVTQLIARRYREAGIYCEIRPYQRAGEEFADGSCRPKAAILSGGPGSAADKGCPKIPQAILDSGIPLFGICYGQQILMAQLGGTVETGAHREFGRARISALPAHEDDPLFDGFLASGREDVWMSHGDRVSSAALGFSVIARSPNAPMAIVADSRRRYYGVQFHPEVHHTPNGARLLRNFAKIAGFSFDWSMSSFRDEAIANIRNQVGSERIVCGLSGGVDSSVTALLVHEAVGSQLTCLFVDHGLLRQGEAEDVPGMFKRHYNIAIEVIDARELFLSRLECVDDPEAKRKIIGELFIDVFQERAKLLGNAGFLAQGTLYPDVIESISVSGGPSSTIKSHHNVGGLPEAMNLEIVEPLRSLFKDEVRKLGRELGLPDSFVNRHPFPGPGLAIRCPGTVTRAKLDILRQADAVFIDQIRSHGLYDEIWQAFAALLPVKSVGVMGDARTYEYTCVLRAVTSVDGMTADYYPFGHRFLSETANRIINEVPGLNRVVYDITSKPPGTIEWE
ncbi:MAG: glutamine-hydrolyzing GMP synthase [Albidovulum sp.]|nr:glutamine-hydrolyzing GMP synthase [Albidovulum sp.]